MPKKTGASAQALTRLELVLARNQGADFRAMVLNEEAIQGLLSGVGGWNTPAERNETAELLKAYQRVLRILPAGEEARALPMLDAGIDSAIRVAAMLRTDFRTLWIRLFPEDAALADSVYDKACSRRAQILLHHINVVQNGEPHYRSARFR